MMTLTDLLTQKPELVDRLLTAIAIFTFRLTPWQSLVSGPGDREILRLIFLAWLEQMEAEAAREAQNRANPGAGDVGPTEYYL